MGPMLVVLGDPRIKVGLQFVDGAVDLFAERHPVAALRPEGCLGLLVTGPGQFHARLTQVGLHRLRISATDEPLSRVALVAVPADMILVCWAAGYGFHGNLGWDQGRSGQVHDARAGPAFAHANRGTLPLGVDLAPYRDPAVILIDP